MTRLARRLIGHLCRCTGAPAKNQGAVVKMRRAIVHIGMPRTGTTTLQRVLTSLRPQLGEAGVLYPDLTPDSAPAPHLSHQHLGETLDGRRPSLERRELLTRLSGLLAVTRAETVFLSYEGLCLLPPSLGIPRMLAALFAQRGFAMEVLVTIKPQGEFINSQYTLRTQFLREHRTFSNYYRAEVSKSTLDYSRLLAPWWGASNGKMSVTPLHDVRSDQPLLARIMTELDLDTVIGPMFSSADLALVENRSPGPVAVEVARRLRMAGGHLQLGRSRREVTRFVETSAHGKELDTLSFRGLQPAFRAEAAARWQSSNDRFAETVWRSSWDSRVANEVARPVNEIAGPGFDPGLVSQVECVLAETCEAFQIRLGSRPLTAVRNIADDIFVSLHRRLRHVRARSG